MNAENVKSQMRKGTLEYCILLLLKKEPAYTSDIIQKLQEAKLIVVEGTLYPLLTRLKNSELLSYQWIESTLVKKFRDTHLEIIHDLIRTLFFAEVDAQVRQIFV